MAKRFTASDKWEDEWFRKLPSREKLFWLFLLDRCDIAGAWKIDYELASFCINEQIDKAILKSFSGRIEPLNGSKLWIIRYAEFQYTILKEDCTMHKAVIKLLASYGLLDRVMSRMIPGYPEKCRKSH